MSYPDNYTDNKSLVVVGATWTEGGLPRQVNVKFTAHALLDGGDDPFSTGEFGDLVTAIQSWMSGVASPNTPSFSTVTYDYIATENA